ncbi:carbohydrate esterase family 5 protein [Aulographum hederae CBS 113979]|uniref:Carbohydrate esterase family 5 protein n=1 Tax=Aulographum hederae CBS 113979 TaxID=1176131 RepID=A0A6G1GVM5_9PEZI|nr:carbohydrate esterase family 5 protein [Aulographum hederae CBS 113979]
MVRLAAVAALSLAAITSAAPLAARQSCASGFHIIVARGSNEDPGEGKAGQVATLIENSVPGSDSVAVDYPAAICCDDLYPGSVSDGIDNTISQIESYVASCPSARIVLVGYSQGGNVMTDVLAGGVLKPDPIGEQYRGNIAGVVVFGDPSFTAGQSFDVGSSTDDGIFARSEGGDSLALLNTYAGVLRSYCDDGDPFCASGTDEDVHSNEVPNHAQQAANFIISLA